MAAAFCSGLTVVRLSGIARRFGMQFTVLAGLGVSKDDEALYDEPALADFCCVVEGADVVARSRGSVRGLGEQRDQVGSAASRDGQRRTAEDGRVQAIAADR